ncbi:MAG: translesion error-prone DNA polymerase V autoproteolytic subunit [Chitinophagaceae bacterium]
MEWSDVDFQFIGLVCAGFPSPASDYAEEDIDLRKYLQPNATSIYLARVKGDSMINAHIPNDSIVVIDKSIKAKSNAVVVATLNGERLIKTFVKTHAGTFLAPSNPAYVPIKVDEDMDFSIWGVVTHVIVKL